MKADDHGPCVGRMCGFAAFGGDIECITGSGSCWAAVLCEAERSSFHDETLQKATEQIKEILGRIPPDSDGRKLSFVHTDHGTLLAWVRHGGAETTGATTFESGRDEVAKALGIKTAR